ncbi:MAG: hypothetical protein L0220_01120 [Acidobacteria bacterium]|nr:hypothetical protein [Acidobacteriota bacterium]
MPSNLSPWQSFLSKKFPGKNVKISNQQYEQAALEFFGPIPIPPGSQIISQSGSQAEYVDADGFRHVLRREINGLSPNVGQISDNTNRPAVPQFAQGQLDVLRGLSGGAGDLSGAQLQNALAVSRGQAPTDTYQSGILNLSQQLQQQPQLLALDPETAAALEQINRAEQTRLAQLEDEQTGQLLARLYGSGVQRSSIAGENLARMLQQFGLVRQQQSADAASRNLAVRQFLTGQQQANRGLALEGLTRGASASQAQTNPLLALLESLSGQQTQRDVTAAGIAQADRGLAEEARRTNLSFEIDQQKADAALAAQNSLFNKILAGLQVGGQLAGGVGTGISTFSNLLNKKPSTGPSYAFS